MKIYKKLAGQTIIYGMGTVVPRFLNFGITSVYLTRVFDESVEDYGTITELYSYVVFLLVILTYGMETGFFRFASFKRIKKYVYSTGLISLFITSGIFIYLVFTYTNQIAEFIGYRENTEYMRILAVIVGIDAFCAITFAKLRKEERAKKFAWIKIINVIVNILCLVLFIEGLPALNNVEIIRRIYIKDYVVGYVFIANMIASITTLILIIPEFFRSKWYFSIKLLKSILKYSYPLLIAGLAGVVNETLDRVLLKHLVNVNYDPLYEVGIYGATYKIAILLFLFIQMFRYAVEPFYFNYYKEKDAKEIFANVMRYFIIISMIIILTISLFIDYFKYIIDENYHEALRIIPVILYSYLFYGIFVNLSVWYKLQNLTKYGAVLTILGAIITIIINVVFVPVYSYHACAWAHFSAYFIMIIISYFLGRRFYKIDYKLKKVFEFIIAGSILIILYNMILNESTVIKLIYSIISVIGYIVYILKREKIRIKTIKNFINES